MKLKLNADRIVSVSAIIVSLATLVMILYQTILTRKEQHVSVMPSLLIGMGLSEDSTLSMIEERIYVENNGLGPAFIEKILIIDSTGEHETDVYGYLQKIDGNRNSNSVFRLFPGVIIPKNDYRPLYIKNSNLESPVILANHFAFPYEVDFTNRVNPQKAIIEIYYKSVYDDHWKIRSDSPIPIELD